MTDTKRNLHNQIKINILEYYAKANDFKIINKDPIDQSERTHEFNIKIWKPVKPTKRTINNPNVKKEDILRRHLMHIK